jgi:NADH-ubiquinone oxidoreductase chain 5
LSAFVFASIGLVQNDLKRIIAYSTASQLGYLTTVCGMSQYNIAFYHIINHAFFKALLFLAAGSVIHSMADQQDVRKMGGLAHLLPYTFVVMLIASLSNIAFPFLSGFYSKEIIILSGYGQFSFEGSFAYWLTTLAAFFTSIYTTRLLYLTFLSIPNGPRNNYKNTHEAPFFMAIPLGILAVLSIVFGYLSKDLFIGLGSDFFANAIFIHPNHIILVDAEFAIPLFIKLLPSILTILGFVGTLLIYEFVPNILIEIKLSKLGRAIFIFLNQKYFFDLIYSRLVVLILNFGYLTLKVVDRGALELVGPTGLTNLFSATSRNLASVDSGYIPNYALYIILAVITMTASVLYLDDARLLLVFVSTLFFISSRHFTTKTNTPQITDSMNLNKVNKFSSYQTREFHESRVLRKVINSYESNILDPNFITGFTDAEGCFSILLKKAKTTIGWQVQASFQIGLHSKDLPLLKKIQKFFGGVGIISSHKDTVRYRVRDIKSITSVIITHFDNYPLVSAKSIDYLLWKQCISLIAIKEHLTQSGLEKIIVIKGALNLGIPDDLKTVFPHIKPLTRPQFIVSESQLNPNWISGFTEGDGTFVFYIGENE